MFKLLFFVVSVIISVSFSATAAEKVVPKLTGKIVGGSSIDIKFAKYQITIQKYGYWHACGGSIISPRCIVTAAHCVPSGDPTDLSVRAGSAKSGEGGQLVKIMKIVLHPNYEKKTYRYDIALLILRADLTFSSIVGAIPLCASPAPENSIATLSGWGTSAEGGEVSPILKQTQVRVISIKDCSTALGFNVAKEMICAYAPGKDSCQGDSGGPMVVNNCLAGVVSWGYGCARVGSPGIYSNIGVLRDWVVKNMK